MLTYIPWIENGKDVCDYPDIICGQITNVPDIKCSLLLKYLLIVNAGHFAKTKKHIFTNISKHLRWWVQCKIKHYCLYDKTDRLERHFLFLLPHLNLL